MKNILLTTLVFGLALNTLANSQTLNQDANWPNNQWMLSGSYNSDNLIENPSIITGAASFSFNDDLTGLVSTDNIAIESPQIDLTAAFNANELYITVTFQYVLNVVENEFLRLQYWDSSQWVNWDNALIDNSSVDTNFCDTAFSSFESNSLDISSLTSLQRAEFKYRIFYNDNSSSGFGFCVNSLNISSKTTPTCPEIQNLTVLNINTVSADVRWNLGGTETEWEIITQLASEPVPNTGPATLRRSHRFSGLIQNTNYVVYVRVKCGAEDFSNWQSKNFTTGINISGMPVSFTSNSLNTLGAFDIALVDLNGDFLDDVVSLSASSINVRYQLPNGGYNNANIITPSADFVPDGSFTAGDFDANGYNDLIYAGESGVTFMKANGMGTGYNELSEPNFVFSQRSNFVDINNDGHLDAFVCHKEEANVYYINDGSGNLTFYQGVSEAVVPNGLGTTPNGGNQSSVWVDFDNDRDVDMFITKFSEGSSTISTNELWRNDGSGVYVNIADINGWYNTNYPGVGHNNSSNLGDNVQASSSAWADFDNDGDMDVFVGAINTTNGNSKLMQNNGDGTFTDITSGSGVIGASLGKENAAVDFDNDGYIDIITNGDVLFNNGDFTFTNFPNNSPLNGAVGDVNNDGFLDIFRSGNIYVNNTTANNWIKINTLGTDSNINGIGARVEIMTPAGKQVRDVRSGEGFEFMSSLNTHFGIGTETSIDNITIYWPSGVVDFIANPTINTTLTIVEGSALSIEDETLVDVSIYPNPVEDILTIKTSADLINKIATVFDMNGKKVLNQKLTTNTLEVSSLGSGIYFLRLESEGRIIKRKFIKK
ncbi:MAG: hypothetical protein ACI9GM_001735 [Salibacteraceae bacterium]|jgi:hypothetical protein